MYNNESDVDFMNEYIKRKYAEEVLEVVQKPVETIVDRKVLISLIDKALDSADKEQFIRLTNQLILVEAGTKHSTSRRRS